MPARLRNFLIERGGDFRRRINVVDADGAPVDLTSYSGNWVVLPSEASADTDALLAIGGTDAFVLGNGYVEILVDRATIDALDFTLLTRSGALTEPAVGDEPDYFGNGKLAWHRLTLRGPSAVDDEVVLRGQICFVSR